MEIKFVKMNPTQNMTILVESPVPKRLQRRMARRLMAHDGVEAEQVGFIEAPRNQAARARLQMMGGEFCGNASMSLAALLAMDEGVEGEAEMPLECSGVKGLFSVKVNPGRRGVKCSLEMPPPLNVTKTFLKAGNQKCLLTQVNFEGVSHFVLPEDYARGDVKLWAEKALTDWSGECRSEAVGLILHNRAENRIRPLVLVKSTGSLVWERGCGSGTAAVGAIMAHEAQKSIRAKILQPGGEIGVKADFKDGRVSRLAIAGWVKMAARGLAYVDF